MKKSTQVLQLLTAIGLILFWTIFFLVGFENPAYPAYYTKFEHSFPLPDAFLCILLLRAYFNRTNDQWKNYTLMAAGAMIFLGLCDFSFNILNGMYTVGVADGIINAFINIWCVGFGAWQVKVVNQ
ncbi:MAG: hypothetical protein IPM95_14905 [Sphingobacteriales bacterium]|jgi:hypothetical protein|nr:hypothetical protein [Sphingobacteriales bacterium]